MSLNSAMLPGTLPVETINALLEGRLRVELPGGFFKVAHQVYSTQAGVRVYQGGLAVSMVVRLTLESRGPILEPAPVMKTHDSGAALTGSKHAN